MKSCALVLLICICSGCLSPRYLTDEVYFMDASDRVKLVNMRPEQYNILAIDGVEYPQHSVAVPPLYISYGWHEIIYEYRTPGYKRKSAHDKFDLTGGDSAYYHNHANHRCSVGVKPHLYSIAYDRTQYYYELASCVLYFEPGTKYTLLKVEKMLARAGCALAD